MTRARQQLFLTSYTVKDNGRPAEPLAWFVTAAASIPAATTLPALKPGPTIVSQELALGWQVGPLASSNLRSQLHSQLSRYKLSTTHVSTFLDITKGGPRAFLYRHLLHFPERQQPSAVFGSAIHEALHAAHTQTTTMNKPPTLKHVIQVFAATLNRTAMSDDERAYLLDRGTSALTLYLKAGGGFQKTDKSEYSFATEAVSIGDVQLTGKVDLIRTLRNQDVSVVDYKTGTAFDSWRPTGAYNQIRAHLYKQQLVFYKLLIENAASFKNKLHVTDSYLQFVEPNDKDQFLQLNHAITNEDEDRLKQLIAKIWERIIALDFPDTSGYSLDLKGLLAFEEDLLDGK
jgi:DNA helicase-2/ATP-dependent DNA helicase PcrA